MSAPVIEVRGLTRRFGDFVAVDHVSFEVAEGEIFGFLGANGAGKSTTIRILCGLLAASEGEVTLAGIDVIRRPDAARRVIGYMSQRFSLYLDLSVDENLEFFGGAYSLYGRVLRDRREAVRRQLDLEMLGSRLAASLPGGIRQRLALACAILHQPRIVFLDEPTAGVSPESRRTFWRLIRRLADSGTTVFVTTHYMDEAEYCDRIGLMAEGRLAALDTPARLKQTLVPGRVLEVRGAGAGQLRDALASHPPLEVESFGAALHVRFGEDGPGAAELVAELHARGLSEAGVTDAEVTLEDVFLRVMREIPRRGGGHSENGGEP